MGGWCITAESIDRRLKAAFAKVKEDILTLRRTANKQLGDIEDLQHKTASLSSKEEFYNFIKHITERIDALESASATSNSLEKSRQQISEEIAALRKAVEEQRIGLEKLEEDKLKKKLSELESRLVRKSELESELTRIKAEAESLSRQFAHQGELEVLRRTISLEVKQLRDNYSRVQQLATSVRKIEDTAITKKQLESEMQRIQEQLSEIDSYLEELSESEELDIVTKQDLKNALGQAKEQDARKLNDHTDRISRLESGLAKLEALASQLQRTARKGEEQPVQEDVDYLKANMATSQELSRLSGELDETASSLRDEVNMQMASFEGRIHTVERELHDLKKAKNVNVPQPPRDYTPLIILILLLIAGGAAFLVLQHANLPVIPINVSNQTTIIPVNVSNQTISNETAIINQSIAPALNISANITYVPVENITNLSEQNLACAEKYECQEHQGQFWFDCSYEPSDGSCKCYLGSKEQCNPPNVTSAQAVPPVQVQSSNGMLKSISVYRDYIVAGVIALLLVILFLELFQKKGENQTELNKYIQPSKRKKKPKSLVQRIKDLIYE